MMQSMLTTIDNPHDPFTNYDEWFEYDRNAGYHSPGLLARIAVVSDEVSEQDQALAIEEAIDEIVFYNVLGVFKKVQKELPEPKVSEII